MSPAPRREAYALAADGWRLVREAMDRAGLSARGVHRALRVARTTANLAGEARVTARALAEALEHRAHEVRRLARA